MINIFVLEIVTQLKPMICVRLRDCAYYDAYIVPNSANIYFVQMTSYINQNVRISIYNLFSGINRPGNCLDFVAIRQ